MTLEEEFTAWLEEESMTREEVHAGIENKVFGVYRGEAHDLCRRYGVKRGVVTFCLQPLRKFSRQDDLINQFISRMGD